MSEQKKETLEVVKDFKYAYRGCDVVEYKAGQTEDFDEEVAELAKANKWAKKPGKKAPAENKDLGVAPENKSPPAEPVAQEVQTPADDQAAAPQTDAPAGE